MEIGQINMVQIPVDATAIVAETASSPVQTGKLGGSVFAGILLDMMPQPSVMSTVVPEAVPTGVQLGEVQTAEEPVAPVAMEVQLKEQLATLTEVTLFMPSSASSVDVELKEPLATLTEVTLLMSSSVNRADVEPYEKDVDPNQSEDMMPQNVVMSSEGAIALMSQNIGRRPESDQIQHVQNDMAGAEPTRMNMQNRQDDSKTTVIVSEVQAQQLVEAYTVATVPDVTVPSPVSAKEAEQPVEAGAIPAKPLVQTHVKAAAPQSVQSKAATVAPCELSVAHATKPIVSEVQAQQLMEAYSVAAVPDATVPSPVSAQEPVQPVEAGAIPAKPHVQTNVQAAAPQSVQSTSAIVTQRELPVAPATKPIVSEVQAQQLMEAYYVATVPDATVPSPVSAKETVQPVEAGAIPAKLLVQTHVQAAAPIEKSMVEQIPVDLDKTLKPLTSVIEQKTIQNVSAAPLAEKTLTQPVMAEAKAAVSELTSNESSAVVLKPEIPAAKTATAGTPVILMQQFMDAYSQPVKVASDVLSPATAADTQPSQRFDKSTAFQAAIVTKDSVVPAEREQGAQNAAPDLVPVVSPVTGKTQEVIMASPAQRVAEMGSFSVRNILKPNDGRAVATEEPHQQKITVDTDAKTAVTAENVLASAIKGVTAATTGEDLQNSDTPLNERVMSVQMHQVAPHQTKGETATSAASVTSGAVDVTEQVAKQVCEHFAKTDIKTGSEQIVLRLSPENLGELRVNLRMENQRLTVEIVTDNRMVRDSLLQNSDSLKESLAKQNIKMDSFDVSTGSNNGFTSRGQNDWRELARQQQHNAWKADSGYRLPSMGLEPIPAIHLAKSAHSMLDIHY